MRRRLAVLSVVALSACGGVDPAAAPDPDADAVVAPDVDADAELDADVDANGDAELDADVGANGDANADAAPEADAPAPPDVDAIPWSTGASVGNGVAFKDTENPIGESSAIVYAGLGVDLAGAESWATALFRAWLHDRGVRYVWAVQGPADVSYSGKEIGNSKIVAALLPRVSTSTKFVLAVAHSSGSFVAHELLGQLAGGLDPTGVTSGRVVYFDLDGGLAGLTSTIVARLRKAYFVGAWDADVLTASPNDASMRSGGASWPPNGAYWQLPASGSGCLAGAVWCMHMTVVTTKPHDPAAASIPLDYLDFTGRAVTTSYLDAQAAEAGLDP